MVATLELRDGSQTQGSYDLSCSALRGDSVVLPLVRQQLPGPDQLQVDGSSLREVHYYNRKQPAAERLWSKATTGGVHQHIRRDPAVARAWLKQALGDDSLLGCTRCGRDFPIPSHDPRIDLMRVPG